MNNEKQLIEITGLWASDDKNGNTMLSGYLGNAKVLIFANTFKQNEKEPDFRMYVAKKDKPQEQSNNTQQQSKVRL